MTGSLLQKVKKSKVKNIPDLYPLCFQQCPRSNQVLVAQGLVESQCLAYYWYTVVSARPLEGVPLLLPSNPRKHMLTAYTLNTHGLVLLLPPSVCSHSDLWRHCRRQGMKGLADKQLREKEHLTNSKMSLHLSLQPSSSACPPLLCSVGLSDGSDV